MTTGAKWVLGVLLAIALGFMALGMGLRDRQAMPDAPRMATDLRAATLYLEFVRSGPASWADSTGIPRTLEALAKGQMGRDYVYGGTTPAGFDCSGFTSWAFRKAGVTIPRTSGEQYQSGRQVEASALRAGDLVFFNQQGRIGHVGIYLSGGRFIHSSRGSGQVGVDSLSAPYWNKNYAGGRRVLADSRKP